MQTGKMRAEVVQKSAGCVKISLSLERVSSYRELPQRAPGHLRDGKSFNSVGRAGKEVTGSTAH